MQIQCNNKNKIDIFLKYFKRWTLQCEKSLEQYNCDSQEQMSKKQIANHFRDFQGI